MYTVGMNPFGGLFTKAQMRQGKIPQQGTRVANVINGNPVEYVVVKLAAGTLINGTPLILDNANVGAAVTLSGAPAAPFNQRVGVLCFASATATQTVAVTAFGFAQIYGQARARCSASITAPGIALGIGTAAQLIQQVGASASAMLEGITAMATNTASTTAELLLNVFLNYPAFSGPPDTNLA